MTLALRLLFLVLLSCAPAARGAVLADATGRSVSVSDAIARVLPAGPPAAVLMAALAPDLMLGWPHKPGADSLAFLPQQLRDLPEVPAAGDTEAVKALHPDLILDYGTVDPGYVEAAVKTQAATGVASVLFDGRLAEIPRVLRLLGHALHRDERAETLAMLAEAMLAATPTARPSHTLVLLRGPNADQALVAGGANSELADMLGFRLLAPDGKGRTFRPVTPQQVAALDPDMVIFLHPAMRAKAAQTADWSALRAVREGHAWAVPEAGFGWLEGPPSLNRLIGLAWIGGGAPDPDVIQTAAMFQAVVYGQAPTATQVAGWREQLRPVGR